MDSAHDPARLVITLIDGHSLSRPPGLCPVRNIVVLGILWIFSRLEANNCCACISLRSDFKLTDAIESAISANLTQTLPYQCQCPNLSIIRRRDNFQDRPLALYCQQWLWESNFSNSERPEHVRPASFGVSQGCVPCGSLVEPNE